MIKYEWRDHLTDTESTELADMLRRAADFDAEPEYSTIDFADVEQAMSEADGNVRHLVIWMLPYSRALGAPDEPEQIAGLIQLTVNEDGTGAASAVVDPRLRSIGIITLLLERVRLDTSAAEGWLGTGVHTVTAWARGNHPAAGRISNRFLIPRTRRVWKLIRSTDCEQEATAASVLEPIDVAILSDVGWAAAASDLDGRLYALREGGRILGLSTLDSQVVRSEEFGNCATIRCALAAPNAEFGSRRRLLDGIAAVAHDEGFSGVIIYVDSDDANLVNACRLAGFQHDRTDVHFELGGRQ